MERWIFLDNESKARVETFAKGLEQTWGNFFDFSAGSPKSRIANYTLERFFQEEGLRDQRIVFGQKFSDGPKIRFFASNGEVICNYFMPYTEQNFRIASSLFRETFGQTIEEYTSQSRVG